MRRRTEAQPPVAVQSEPAKPRPVAEVLTTFLTLCRDRFPNNPEPAELEDRAMRILDAYRWHATAIGRRLGREESRILLLILIAHEFFPDDIPKLEKALEPARDIVDEAWVSVDVTNRKIDMSLYCELLQKADQIALRRLFQKEQAEARERLAQKHGGEIPCPS